MQYDLTESMLLILSEPRPCLRVTSIFLSLAVTHSLSEKLVLICSLEASRYQSWAFLQVQVGSMLHKLPPRLQFLTDDRWNKLIILTALVASFTMMLASLETWLFSSAAIVCTVAMFYSSQRNLLGSDGTHHMLIVGGAAVAAASLCRPGSIAFNACLCYQAAQCILSYFLAGVAKTFGQSWRDGTAVAKILGTTAYGRPRVGRFLQSRRNLGRALSYATCLFELSFPIILILPPEGVILLLGVALMFHLGTAAFMGLGHFCLTFVTGYPSIIYCWTLIWGRNALLPPDLL